MPNGACIANERRQVGDIRDYELSAILGIIFLAGTLIYIVDLHDRLSRTQTVMDSSLNGTKIA